MKMKDIILCKATMENCYNHEDSYSEICVGCNCCGELDKNTMYQCRYKKDLEHLQEEVSKFTDDYFQTKIQQTNTARNIISYCNKLIDSINHIYISNETDVFFEKVHKVLTEKVKSYEQM